MKNSLKNKKYEYEHDNETNLNYQVYQLIRDDDEDDEQYDNDFL